MQEIHIIDFVIVIAGGIAGNLIFNNFEKHVPQWRRIAKFAGLLTVLFAIALLAGRIAFYVTLVVLLMGQAILHGWYFRSHGIHWRTAEPYDKYLKLIDRMKRRRRRDRT